MDLFRTAARRYSKGLPPLLHQLSQSDFQKYADDRMRIFYSGLPEDVITKKRVTVLGKQSDSTTFVFGPKLAFMEKGGRIVSVPLEETGYAWIPTLLQELVISDAVIVNPDLLFQQAAESFPKESVLAFALTLGGFYMDVHQECVLEKFHRCPTIVCVGDTNCGKTYAVNRSANFFASNAAALFEHKSLTPAAARQKSSQQTFPVILQDPDVVDSVVTLIEEMYDGKPVTTQKDSLVPRASLIITCNKDLPARLRELKEFPQQKARDCVKSGGLPTCSKQLLELLLLMTDEILEEIAGYIDDVFDEVLANLQKYGMSESVERIAFNISMVFGFTVKVLDLPDKTYYIDIQELRAFVTHDLTKFAATWQTVNNSATSSKKRYKEPAVPMSPAKKPRSDAQKPRIDTIMEGILDSFAAEEVRTMMKITGYSVEGQTKKYVALNEARVMAALKSRQTDAEFMSGCREEIRNIPGSVNSHEVRFGKDKSRSMLIPVNVVKNAVLRRLSGEQEEPGKVEEREERTADSAVVAAQGAALSKENLEATTAKTLSETESLVTMPEESGTPATSALLAGDQFPSPPSSEFGHGEIIPTEHASAAGSSGTARTAKPRFNAAITREEQAKGTLTKRPICGKGFPTPGQLLKCESCDNNYHRNCQVVKSGTFLGINAAKWQCRSCKDVAKAAKDATTETAKEAAEETADKAAEPN